MVAYLGSTEPFYPPLAHESMRGRLHHRFRQFSIIFLIVPTLHSTALSMDWWSIFNFSLSLPHGVVLFLIAPVNIGFVICCFFSRVFIASPVLPLRRIHLSVSGDHRPFHPTQTRCILNIYTILSLPPRRSSPLLDKEKEASGRIFIHIPRSDFVEDTTSIRGFQLSSLTLFVGMPSWTLSDFGLGPPIFMIHHFRPLMLCFSLNGQLALIFDLFFFFSTIIQGYFCRLSKFSTEAHLIILPLVA